MENRNYLILGFIVLMVVQWAVPWNLIMKGNSLMKSGEVYNFRIHSLDSGTQIYNRALQLSLVENRFRSGDAKEYEAGSTIYVILEKDDSNFGKIHSLSRGIPDDGSDYVEALVHIYSEKDTAVIIDFPFTRYFVGENLVESVNTAIRNQNMKKAEDQYIAVRVKDGKARIEELYIRGMPLREWLKSL